jgi:hypothetical protein
MEFTAERLKIRAENGFLPQTRINKLRLGK